MSETHEQRTESPREARRAARADAAAAKVRAKAARPWYRKKRIMVPLMLVVLIVVVAVAGGGDTGETVPAETAADAAAAGDAGAEQDGDAEAGGGQADAAEEPETVAVGKPAADGAFTFTVDGVECGEDHVGDDVFGEDAQGQFCVLSVQVENTGDQAGSLLADNQYLLDAGGQRYSADGEATFALDPQGDSWFSEINPGNVVEGEIVFDVPADADIVSAELHDSPFSGGVEVDLQ